MESFGNVHDEYMGKNHNVNAENNLGDFLEINENKIEYKKIEEKEEKKLKIIKMKSRMKIRMKKN